MLTRQGRAVVSISLTLIAAGLLLGVSELRLMGIAGLLLCATAITWVRFLRVPVETRRVISPARVHAGGSVTVDLEVTNRGKRRTPALVLHEIAGTHRPDTPRNDKAHLASLDVAPMQPGASVLTSYVLHCGQRGRMGIGPSEVTLTDPFGLASRVVQRDEPSELIVWPALHHIDALTPLQSGQDGRLSSRAHSSFAGSDLVGLRPYRSGDDLRHVHWKASARYDDLMIRQLEPPFDDLITLIVDTRASTHSRTSFEQGLEVATAILIERTQGDARVRLLLTRNPSHPELFDSGNGSGRSFTESLLDQLALVRPNPTAELNATIADLHLAIGPGVVGSSSHSAIIIGGDPNDLSPLIDALGRHGNQVLALSFAETLNRTSDPNIVLFDQAAPFASALSKSIERRR